MRWRIRIGGRWLRLGPGKVHPLELGRKSDAERAEEAGLTWFTPGGARGPAANPSTARGGARVHRRDPGLPRSELRVDRRREHPGGYGRPVHPLPGRCPARHARHASLARRARDLGAKPHAGGGTRWVRGSRLSASSSAGFSRPRRVRRRTDCARGLTRNHRSGDSVPDAFVASAPATRSSVASLQLEHLVALGFQLSQTLPLLSGGQ